MPFVIKPIPVLARHLSLLALLSLAGCNPSGGPGEIRNDDYETPTEPDYALRQLLGVRTLRTSFEMPEEMKTYRVGLIYIEDEQVTASEWMSGQGLHTVHSGGLKELAKTIYVEYLSWKNDGSWEEILRITPSFTTRSLRSHEAFWNAFEDAKLRSQGHSAQPFLGNFGEFRVLGATYGAKENVATGQVDSLLRNMDFLILLVVDFLPEAMSSESGMVELPTDEELQGLLKEEIGGTR